MGGGKKLQRFTLGGKMESTSSKVNNGVTARNLRKNDLGGVIFGCTRYTMAECLSGQIFGLPGTHFSYIKNIEPGLPLFLFNYSDRKLHGIFQAASLGQMNINPYGWSSDGSRRTQFPAQVRIHIRMQCIPLSEEQFKPVIKDNYYSEVHFLFELDHAQTGALTSLFESSPVQKSIKLETPSKPVFKYIRKIEKENSPPLLTKDSLVQSDNLDSSSQNKPDIPAVVTLEPVEISEDEDSRPSVSEFDADGSHQTRCLAGAPYLDDRKKQNAQPKEEMESEVELVCSKLEQLVLYNGCAKPSSEAEECIAPLEYECEQDGPMSSDEKDEGLSVNSSDSQPSIDQLRQENDKLKVSSLEKDQQIAALKEEVDLLRKENGQPKVSSMEKDHQIATLKEELVKSDIQVKQLELRVKELESQLVTSTTGADELLNQSTGTSETLEEWLDGASLGNNGLIFFVGGYDDNSWLSALDCYSFSRDSMKSLKPMSSSRSYATAATLNGEIYVFGGRDGSLWYDTVESYNPLLNEWTPRPSLFQKRGFLAGVTLNNKIFAIGGGNGVECFSNVEMFDPVVGRWIPTQSMREKRHACAAAELNGAVYAVGGFDGNNYLKSAERFDPRELSWSRLPSMTISRGCHSLVVLNEKLYALGGYDGAKMVPSVEVFDPRTGSWTVDQEMNESRGYSTAAVIGETIYLISGLKEGNTLSDTVEYYKEGSGWSIANVKGVGKRSFSASVVL